MSVEHCQDCISCVASEKQQALDATNYIIHTVEKKISLLMGGHPIAGISMVSVNGGTPYSNSNTNGSTN